jgi:hypothetical protein
MLPCETHSAATVAEIFRQGWIGAAEPLHAPLVAFSEILRWWPSLMKSVLC